MYLKLLTLNEEWRFECDRYIVHSRPYDAETDGDCQQFIAGVSPNSNPDYGGKGPPAHCNTLIQLWTGDKRTQIAVDFMFVSCFVIGEDGKTIDRISR